MGVLHQTVLRHCQIKTSKEIFESIKIYLRNGNNYLQRQMPAANSGLAKVAVQRSADTFVVIQTLVLRINICGKNRHLRQAAKRYVPF